MKLNNEHILQFYKVVKDYDIKRYVVFSDTHIPFEDKQLLNKAIEQSKGDTLLLVGDLIDGYSASHYPKDKPITFEEEVEKCKEWLHKFSKRFDRVYICLGNHDYRIIKQLEALPTGIVSYVKTNVMYGFLSSLSVAKNIIIGSWWLLFINDIAIAHADTYSKLPLKPVLTLQDYIAKVHPDKYENVNVIMQGHTHHIGVTVSYNKVLLQLPCMQGEAYYRYKDRLSSSINYEWHKGWVEMDCKNGKVVTNSIKLII